MVSEGFEFGVGVWSVVFVDSDHTEFFELLGGEFFGGGRWSLVEVELGLSVGGVGCFEVVFVGVGEPDHFVSLDFLGVIPVEEFFEFFPLVGVVGCKDGGVVGIVATGFEFVEDVLGFGFVV